MKQFTYRQSAPNGGVSPTQFKQRWKLTTRELAHVLCMSHRTLEKRFENGKGSARPTQLEVEFLGVYNHYWTRLNDWYANHSEDPDFKIHPDFTIEPRILELYKLYCRSPGS